MRTPIVKAPRPWWFLARSLAIVALLLPAVPRRAVAGTACEDLAVAMTPGAPTGFPPPVDSAFEPCCASLDQCFSAAGCSVKSDLVNARSPRCAACSEAFVHCMDGVTGTAPADPTCGCANRRCGEIDPCTGQTCNAVANCEFDTEHPSLDYRTVGAAVTQYTGGSRLGLRFKPKNWDTTATALGGAFVGTTNVDLYVSDPADDRDSSKWVLLETATVTAPLSGMPANTGYVYQPITPVSLRPDQVYVASVNCQSVTCWSATQASAEPVPDFRNYTFYGVGNVTSYHGVQFTPGGGSLGDYQALQGLADVELVTRRAPALPHAPCATGAALTTGKDWCVDKVCAAQPSCCSSTWDSTCVSKVAASCGKACSGGQTVGLTPGCDGSGVCLGRLGESCSDVCTRVGKVCDKYQIPLVSGVGGVQQLEHFGKCPSTQSIPQPNYGDYYIASHATTTPYTCYDVTDANYTSYECSTHYDVMSRLCYCVDQPISPTQYLDTFGSDVEGWVSDFSQGTCTGGTTSFGRVCDGTSGGCRARMRISCPNDPGAWFYMYKRYSTAPWNTPTPHKMMLQFDWRCSSASAAHNVCGYRIKRNAPRPSDGVQTFQFSLTNATTADTGYQHFGPVDITQYASGTSYIFVQARIEDTWTGDDDHQMWMDNVQLYIQ